MRVELLEPKLAFNPFAGKQQAKTSEIEKKVEVQVDELVQNIFDAHEEDGSFPCYYDRPVLSPAQLEHFLQKALRESTNLHWSVHCLSGLLQVSYEHGNNDFVLTTGDVRVLNLLATLEGKEDNPINAVVYGFAGDYFGCHNKYCNFEVYGDVGMESGRDCSNSSFKVHGNSHFRIGYESKNCIFDIKGDARRGIGIESRSCTYIIHGDIEECTRSPICCTFKTPNIQTFKKMKQYFGMNEVLLVK